jgi:Na+-transporting NADH:ubiquinone oxidoreductase subunit A
MTDRLVALTGAQVSAPKYAQTKLGANIDAFTKGQLLNGDNRIISGNVLTGEALLVGGFIGFYDAQVTVILEGREPEFLGWGTLGLSKWSVSRTFWSWLMPKRTYDLNTNMHGGHRPYVVTNEYEKVVPMDVLPVQLIKAILVDDIDLMEQLGIYEVAEEDLALCEVICTSKTEVQRIVRMGLDKVRKEMS